MRRCVVAVLCLLLLGWGLGFRIASAQSMLINGSRVITGAFNFCAEASDDDTNVNTYRCALAPAIAGYRTGTRYTFTPFTTNTGAATLNLNSLGAKTIKKMAGAITTDLVANDIRAGQIIDVIYDGTNMQMQSQLGNAPAGTGDVVGPSASADSEIALFNSTTGKLIKRATGSGLALLTSGVLSTATAPAGTVTGTIASGTIALATSAISSGACATAQTATATGTASTDVIMASFNADVSAVTGYAPLTTGNLRVDIWPSTNTINLKVCNGTASSVTPGSASINWRVVR